MFTMRKELFLKVVTSEEMARIEKIAFSQGFSDLDFMENAGRSIANTLFSLIKDHKEMQKILVFAGKGNNGGDAFVAARQLSSFGISVKVVHQYLDRECSALCQMQKVKFLSEFPHAIISELSAVEINQNDLILDGLVGTGFTGPAQGRLLEAIEKINSSKATIVSIDIPSGLSGTRGKGETQCVKADITIYLELPKWGFFVGDGWKYVGKIIRAPFGLDEKIVSIANACGLLPVESEIKDLMPNIDRCWHKYQRGYVLGYAGNKLMQGAAILSASAALRSGSGIVRLFYPQEYIAMMPVEVIQEPYDTQRFLDEAIRASSCFIGPGLGRDELTFCSLKDLLNQIKIPSVLDADALYYLSKDPMTTLPDKVVLTPHHGEMSRLLASIDCLKEDQDLLAQSQVYANRNRCTIVLKGSPTFIISPDHLPIVMPFGDPGLATAGSGDVLTGIISSLLSQKLSIIQSCILGVFIHAKSGEFASQEKTSYGFISSDIISHISSVLKLLLKRDRIAND
jgi:NAD(P)H-hydrate epimerase